MAKDRRQQKKSPWQQRRVQILAAAGAVLLVILLIVLLTRPKKPPADSPTIPPVAVSTTSAITTTVTTTAATTTTAQETTTTEEETTTTEDETTTTEATTTTAAPVIHDDGNWNLVLVNPWNPYPEELVRGEEDNLVQVGYSSEYVDYRILDQLNAMLDAGAEYGLAVTSSYRSYDDQVYFYNNKVDRVMASEGCSYEEALDIAATEVARPGTSEHHTGLAVDLVHNECWELEEYWEDSAAFDWLMEHCADYGFILRYPKSSQHITGVIYEPWHYRYVGVEAAQAIMSQGITLEEYLG